jgi:peptide deformylase
MAIRKTVQVGHPALTTRNKKIVEVADRKFLTLIQDLIDTMRAEDLVGMAAPWIAENFQIFVTEPRETATRPKDQADELRVYINPKIVDLSAETVLIYEGCGSVLHGQLFGPVVRPRVVTIEAFNERGRQFRLTADGLLGRVIQHEYDHLHGIEFLEKVADYKQLMAVEYYIERIKPNPRHVKACEIGVKTVSDK